MTSKVIHENDTYKIVVGSLPSEGYKLINKETGVVEKEGGCLPELIGEAEQSNAYLKYEAWAWIDEQVKQQVDQATAWFGTHVEVELEEDPGDAGPQLLN